MNVDMEKPHPPSENFKDEISQTFERMLKAAEFDEEEAEF
jgi:hypothetical protein